MRELPSPTTEIVCEPLLYLSGAAAASTLPMNSPRVKWTPLLHRIGKVEVHIRFQWWVRAIRPLLRPCLNNIVIIF